MPEFRRELGFTRRRRLARRWGLLARLAQHPGGHGHQEQQRKNEYRTSDCHRLVMRETCAHERNIIIRQNTNYFLSKMIDRSSSSRRVTLVIGGAALFYVLAQTVIQVLFLAPFIYFGQVVQP